MTQLIKVETLIEKIRRLRAEAADLHSKDKFDKGSLTNLVNITPAKKREIELRLDWRKSRLRGIARAKVKTQQAVVEHAQGGSQLLELHGLDD